MQSIIYFCLLILFSVFTYRVWKSNRILAIPLFIYSYYLLLFFLNSLAQNYFFQEAAGKYLVVSEKTKWNVSLYVMIFSFFFGIIFYFLKKIFKFYIINRSVEQNNICLESGILFKLVFFMWLLGLPFFLESFSLSYEDYVTQVTNWPMVFFFSSSSISLFFLKRKKLFGSIIFLLPSIIISLNTGVRSFILLGLFPYLIAFMDLGFIKILWGRTLAIIIGMVLFYLIFVLRNESTLVDAILPLYTEIIFDRTENYMYVGEGLPDFFIFSERVFFPILRFFGYKFSLYTDTPVYMAEQIMGFKGVNHFPSTIFAEARVLYPIYGILVFPFAFWIIIFFIHFLMYKFKIEYMLLPFYVWYSYNFIRGTIMIASLPFSYAMYFVFIMLFIEKYIRASVTPRIL